MEEAQWNNNSMTVNGNFFEVNFTIPNADEYLGQLDVYIRANDTDYGWIEVSLGSITVLNNQPVISNELSNQTASMYRN
ncbi:MAG: hypothetical protein ACTSQI_19675, partial [Candidatus Helarchaeota archaeon]